MKTKIFVVSLRSTIHTKIFGANRQEKRIEKKRKLPEKGIGHKRCQRKIKSNQRRKCRREIKKNWTKGEKALSDNKKKERNAFMISFLFFFLFFRKKEKRYRRRSIRNEKQRRENKTDVNKMKKRFQKR